MNGLIFDSHAHYDDKAFDPDRGELLAALPQNGVGGVVNCGASLESSRTAVALAEAILTFMLRWAFIRRRSRVFPRIIWNSWKGLRRSQRWWPSAKLGWIIIGRKTPLPTFRSVF